MDVNVLAKQSKNKIKVDNFQEKKQTNFECETKPK